jgi:hypothetical protein
MRLTNISRKTLARLLDPTSKLAAPMTGTMISVTMTVMMISAMTTTTAAMIIVSGVGRMTLGGGRAATDQLTTPSTSSS